MARILIIDDNETMREGMAATVRRMGHEAKTAAGGNAGLTLMRREGADFVITDLKMEGVGGLEVTRVVKEIDPTCPVLIVTAFGSVETAVEAMRLQAMDFLQKPFPPEVLRLKVERALELRGEKQGRARAEAEVEVLRAHAAAPYGGEIVGHADPMRVLYQTIEKVAPPDIPVLIHGESGTGKELVARAIHNRSKRGGKAFVKVNCGALTETLLESELFGHEKGAFTGAIKRKLGRFELADGGTLFLDEVGDMTPGLQLKLLRVLQEKEFERVGGEETIHVDVRVISATHRDLKKEVETGRFREDLFYRLHVVPCVVPPLRERLQDIPMLVGHFIAKHGPRINPAVEGIDEVALARLSTHQWPGNVRELENAVE
jgi:two-component system, NtrC family, response regulator HydG